MLNLALQAKAVDTESGVLSGEKAGPVNKRTAGDKLAALLQGKNMTLTIHDNSEESYFRPISYGCC